MQRARRDQPRGSDVDSSRTSYGSNSDGQRLGVQQTEQGGTNLTGDDDNNLVGRGGDAHVGESREVGLGQRGSSESPSTVRIEDSIPAGRVDVDVERVGAGLGGGV